MEYLKSKQFALLIAILAVLLVLTPNTASVFADLSSFEGTSALIHGIAYSLFLEAGIIWFALRKKVVAVGFFMAISAMIHVGYYWDKIITGSIYSFLSVIVAVSLPVMVYLIAEETSKSGGVQKKKKKLSVVQQAVQRSNSNKSRILELLHQGLSDQQIATKVGVNRSTVYRIRKAA